MLNNVNTFNAAKIKPAIFGFTDKDAEKINAIIAEVRKFEGTHNYLIDILQQQIRILNVTISDGLALSASGTLTLGNELTALQLLADTAGFIKKVSDGVYSIDTSTYQPLNNELSALAALADTAGFVKKTGDGTYVIDTNTYCTEDDAIAYAIALG